MLMKKYTNGEAFSIDSAVRGKMNYLPEANFINSNGMLIDEKGKFVCMAHSQLARDFKLVGNDDNRGQERYYLVNEIVNFFNAEDDDDFTNRVKPKIIAAFNNKFIMGYNQNKKDPSQPLI